MYAIIEEGGKQFKVTSGDTILIDRADYAEKTIKFDQVLLVGGEGAPKIGAPLVKGATVTADVMGAEKGIKTDGPFAPDISIAKQRPAEYVFSRHVEIKLDEIQRAGKGKLQKPAKPATAA